MLINGQLSQRKLVSLVFGWVFFLACGSLANAAPVLNHPVDTVATAQPEFSWQVESGATHYQLLIRDGARSTWVHNAHYQQADICDGVNCAITPSIQLEFSDRHAWYVRSRGAGSWTPWSRTRFRYVDAPPPALATLAPTGPIDTPTPTFEWNAYEGASNYQLLVRDAAGRTTLLNRQFTAEQVCDGDVCEIAPAELEIPFSRSLFFRVRARNSGGWGPWSEPSRFSRLGELPVAVHTLSPVGQTETATPVYRWQPVSGAQGASHYQLLVHDAAGRTTLLNRQFSAEQVCDGHVCEIAPAGLEVPFSRSLFFRVRARNSRGWGPWSEPSRFSRLGALPVAVHTFSPVGQIDTATPVYSWQPVAEVSDYHLVIRDVAAQTTLFNRRLSASSVCTDDVCELMPEGVVLSESENLWFRVRALNVSGWGPWSSVTRFSYSRAGMPPQANNDVTTVAAGGSIDIDILANDTDADGHIHRDEVTLIRMPACGNAVIQAYGVVRYTNTDTSCTEDSFTYTVLDNDKNVSNEATVSITIEPAAVAPIAMNDSVSIGNGETVSIGILDNDDGSIDVSSVIVIQSPANAADVNGFVVRSDGTVLYTHNGGASTSDSFQYLVSSVDGLESNVATVTVSIAPAIVPIVAVNDEVSIAQGETIVIDVVGNDQGGVNRADVFVISSPSNASAFSIDPVTGNVTYTHDGNGTTTDSFSYRVRSLDGRESNDGVVTITIAPSANQAPIAVADSTSVAAGGSVTIDVLLNDSDPDGQDDIVPSSLVVSDASSGTVEVVNGQVVYTNTDGSVAQDAFSYTFSDAAGLTASASVTVTVLQTNQAPTAVNDTFAANAGAATVLDVALNDTDPDGNDEIDRSSVVIATAPTSGTVSVVGDVVTYTVDADTASLEDSFTYTVQDASGAESAPATVTININVAPVALADNATVAPSGEVTIDVLANDTDRNDGDTQTISVVTNSSFGSAVVGNGGVIYTNSDPAATEDSFTYLVTDSGGLSSEPVTVTVTIDDGNQPPVAVNDTFAANAGTATVLDVALNDTDPDGNNEIDRNSVIITTAPTSGTVTVVADVVTYTADADTASLQDSFTYTIQDTSGAASAPGTVTVDINLAPVALADAATVESGGSVTVDVLANDSDANPADALSINIVTPPASGLVAVADDLVTYTNVDTTVTQDSFTYSVTDVAGLSSEVVTVSLSITAANQAPIAGDDQVVVTAATDAVIDVLGTDNDPDGDLLVAATVTIVDSPALGIATAQADGTVIYTVADTVTVFEDSFSYTVEDANGLVSNAATVTVTINIAPVAVADEATVTAGIAEIIQVGANDSDANGDAITDIRVVTTPAFGTAVEQADGTIIYTADADTTEAVDSFTYLITDVNGAESNEATVTVEIAQDTTGNGLLTALHRDGQTFLTWDETGATDQYHVYRASFPITPENLNQATQITNRWGPLPDNTSVNLHGGAAPGNYVIEDNGTPLSDDTGLFVYTTQAGEAGSAIYYAVTSVSNGIEDTSSVLSLSMPIAESVDTPSDVLTASRNGGLGRLFTQYMDYLNWNPTFNGYAYNYAVTLPNNYNPAQSYPLEIQLHAFGDQYLYEDSTEFDVIEIHPSDPTAPGIINSWWYGYAADHNYNQSAVPASGRIANFTEQRIMRSVDTLIANPQYNIDQQSIYALGHSMGASGAIALGLRYPSVLTGVYANEGMTNYRASSTFQDELRQLFGTQASNLPIVNGGPRNQDIARYSGQGVWDWMNHQQQIVSRRGDEFAHLMTVHGKRDQTIVWESQGRPWIGALEAANASHTVRYENEGHAWLGFDFAGPPIRTFGLGFDDAYPWRYPLSRSLPAITGFGDRTVNPIPPSSDTSGAGGLRESYNRDVEWDSIVDLPNQYEVTLFAETDAGLTANITPRRTQQFSVNPGQACSWQATVSGVTTTGTATADADALVTATSVPLGSARTRLVINCQ